ncbi:MAG TPA: decaprenyl-phosphate phosphoribosyltransferase, partial [Armatimonadota bacterium]
MSTHYPQTLKQSLLALLVSMRPRQWTKNLAVFAALVFSRTAGNPVYLSRTFEAFVIFCFLSG